MHLKFLFSIGLLSFSIMSFSSSSLANESINSSVKQELITKLDVFQGFSSNFIQDVIDADGNVLQQSMGKLIVKRPNLIYWETEQPDETLVVSDGDTLWFYNPFVEQVSAFSVKNAVANTPILLLSDTRLATWQDYHVSKSAESTYTIIALDTESQVKSLQLEFSQDKINKFIIVDATGQLSNFTLSNVDTRLPDESLFTFSLPQGVDLDDQR